MDNDYAIETLFIEVCPPYDSPHSEVHSHSTLKETSK